MNTETKLAIGIYYVIGYGSDCDGYSSFNCHAFVNEKKAIQFCDSQNEWSDGVRHYITSNMETVRGYCDDFNRNIPFAILDEDDLIERIHTIIK
jgi:hypothetical protein